ncbi:hypothetical protein C8Q73DRAFT_309964 [Cubamyces lactineus]|nr:hypothetical protein C8Q73DRAFT_309964 [Cubamyces lactineus]
MPSHDVLGVLYAASWASILSSFPLWSYPRLPAQPMHQLQLPEQSLVPLLLLFLFLLLPPRSYHIVPYRNVSHSIVPLSQPHSLHGQNVMTGSLLCARRELMDVRQFVFSFFLHIDTTPPRAHTLHTLSLSLHPQHTRSFLLRPLPSLLRTLSSILSQSPPSRLTPPLPAI